MLNFAPMRSILTDFDSGKRKESRGWTQIFRIFGHQQPCRYGEEIYIYKIEDSYFVCVLSLFLKGVFSVKVSTVIFSQLFHHDVISWSFTCWKSLLTLKVPHQQEFFEHFHFWMSGCVDHVTYWTFKEKRLMYRWPTNQNIFASLKNQTKKNVSTVVRNSLVLLSNVSHDTWEKH